MEESVVLLDFWPSSYAMRVKIALAEKGIKFEAKAENLSDKSALLLETNPVHKTIPVLIHNGKPICESLVILEYIDEAWSEKSPLLPSDPYQRSQARFWADFVDKKVYGAGKKVWKAKAEEQEELREELVECLKRMEAELGDKPFFGGDAMGLVDVVLVPLSCWFYTFETFARFSIEAECPKIVDWVKRCLQRHSVSSSLPHPNMIYDYALQLSGKASLIN